MANTFLKINTGPVTLEVGAEDEYLKISIENTETHDYSEINLEKDVVKELMCFIKKKQQEL